MSEITLLDRLLEPGGLTVVFQPIMRSADGGWRLHALEALVRGPRGTNMESAEVLFEYVRRKREESLVDRECFSRALLAAQRVPGKPVLSINVHASTLGRDRNFVAFVADAAAAHGVSPARLCVEIVEHSPSWDGTSFQRALDTLREIGARIALDDIGLGQSNYRMILDCHPNYFKIDRYVVKGAGEDSRRRAVLRSLAGLAEDFGAETVAEGVENTSDLDVVLELGIGLVQGFLLAPPMTVDELRQSPLLCEDDDVLPSYMPPAKLRFPVILTAPGTADATPEFSHIRGSQPI